MTIRNRLISRIRLEALATGDIVVAADVKNIGNVDHTFACGVSFFPAGGPYTSAYEIPWAWLRGTIKVGVEQSNYYYFKLPNASIPSWGLEYSSKYDAVVKVWRDYVEGTGFKVTPSPPWFDPGSGDLTNELDAKWGYTWTCPSKALVIGAEITAFAIAP